MQFTFGNLKYKKIRKIVLAVANARILAEQISIILLDSAIRQRYAVASDSLTIHFELMNGYVVLGSAKLGDREPVSSLEVKCYFDAVNKLTEIILQNPSYWS